MASDELFCRDAEPALVSLIDKTVLQVFVDIGKQCRNLVGDAINVFACFL